MRIEIRYNEERAEITGDKIGVNKVIIEREESKTTTIKKALGIVRERIIKRYPYLIWNINISQL